MAIKRTVLKIGSLSLCALLLWSATALAAPEQTAKPTPTPKESASTKDSRKVTRKPPYRIVINAQVQKDRSVETAKWIEDVSFQLDVTSTDFIDGSWDGTAKLVIDSSLNALEFEAVGGHGNFGISSIADGKAQLTMKKTHDYYPLPTPKRGFKTKTEAEKEKADKEFVKTNAQYSASTQVPVDITYANTLGGGSMNFDLFDPTEDAQMSGDLLAMLGIGNAFKGEYTVDLEVFGDDRVTATVVANGQSYGPFTGKLTTEEEIRWEHKESQKLPVWGIWSGVGHYEPLPRVQNDDKTRKNLDKRTGRWLQLTQGRNKELGENYLGTYQLITATEDQVISETGTLQACPNTFKCLKVKLLTFNRDDPQNPVESDGADHLMTFTYESISDTIYGRDIGGRMVRVRNANLFGTWSTVSAVAPMPDPEKQTVDKNAEKGIWYRFDKRTEEQRQSLGIDPTQGNIYTYVRVDTTDGQRIKKETGTAIFLPMADGEWIQLQDASGAIYPWGGGEPTSYTPEGMTLAVEGAYGQSTLITLSEVEYHRFTPDPLKGTWSSLKGVQPPNPENGQFEGTDGGGKAVALKGGEQWWNFDDKAGTFRHVVYCVEEQGEGLLIESGSYRRTQVDQILLSAVTGSFYLTTGEGWKDRALPEGDICYRFSLDTAGNIVLHPMEQTLYKLGASGK